MVENEMQLFLKNVWKSFGKTAENLFLKQPIWDTVKQVVGTIGDWIVESGKNMTDGVLDLADVLLV